MKRIFHAIFCVVMVVVIESCGVDSELEILEIDTEVQGNYELQEIDIAQVGIGNPAGICIVDNSIYICDTDNNCVVELDEEMKKVSTYGTLGMEGGNFSNPMDITFSEGYFYVLDSGNNRVQKFSNDFTHIESYNLEPLLSEQGVGIYLSIAVNSDGEIFVSVYSSDIEDAYIYCHKDDTWKKLGNKLIGYMCQGSGNIYFANMLEMHVEEKKMIAQSGNNTLFKIDSKSVEPIAHIEYGYVPVAITNWNDVVYMVSAGYGSVNWCTEGSEELETEVVLNEVSLRMYMSIDDKGNIYVTDNENKKLYCMKK